MQHSDGYSSQVRLWLIVDEGRFELAQVGPDQCTLRQPAAFGQCSAQIIIDIDGRQHASDVYLVNGNFEQSRKVSFRPA